MSRAVQFDDVRTAVERFGTLATLITVTPASTPHVVTSHIDIDSGSDRLLAAAGSRTVENLTGRPQVTLVWHTVDDGDYQLILDGIADEIGEPGPEGLTKLSITIDRGILHRVAGRPHAGPTCRSIGRA